MNEPIYSRSRRPLRLLIALALLVAGLALALLLVLVLRDALDPLARAEREAARWRVEQLDAQLAPLNLVVAAGWRLLPLVLAAGAGGVALVVAYRRWGGHQYIQAEHVTRALEAIHRHPGVPQTLTYTTHYAPHLRAPAAALPGDVAAKAPQLVQAPTFAQLLASGRVGRGNPLLLGFDTDTGAELIGSWLDLYSTAVSGMPGSGKTTSQRFLACQTALHGARFAICDPHAGAADDSLAATLAPSAPPSSASRPAATGPSSRSSATSPTSVAAGSAARTATPPRSSSGSTS